MVSHIFGPVPSRRLGRSLGIDLVPFKTCTYDCIYCQLGRTTHKTIQRKEWTPLTDVMNELKERLACNPDYISLSGSGEPTLYSRLEELIAKIKEMTDIPVAVITNGSLLWLPEVRSSIKQADLVLPSLDTGSDLYFQYVNRPDPKIGFDHLMEGLIKFRREYQGQYWLEVFILGGVTTVDKEVVRLTNCIRKINPDRIQLNTVTRPPTESFAMQASREQLENIVMKIGDNAELMPDYQPIDSQIYYTATCDDILELIRRRPCSVEDIAQGLGLHRNEVVKYLEHLSGQGKIHSELQNNQLYYLKRSHLL
ncbi:MAG: radical SAM protein [Sedimentisphaerales bacterium]|nr:radical SAM protein [Sedimentisphaerales bacterium]